MGLKSARVRVRVRIKAQASVGLALGVRVKFGEGITQRPGTELMEELGGTEVNNGAPKWVRGGIRSLGFRTF